jgi:hypothetical protein
MFQQWFNVELIATRLSVNNCWCVEVAIKADFFIWQVEIWRSCQLCWKHRALREQSKNKNMQASFCCWLAAAMMRPVCARSDL